MLLIVTLSVVVFFIREDQKYFSQLKAKCEYTCPQRSFCTFRAAVLKREPFSDYSVLSRKACSPEYPLLLMEQVHEPVDITVMEIRYRSYSLSELYSGNAANYFFF